MAEHRKAKEMPKPPESKIKKAAKKFGKFLGTAALATAISVSPFSLGFPKSVFSDKKIEFVKKANAEEIQTILLKDVEDAIANTQKLIAEGQVKEVKITTNMDHYTIPLSDTEWIMEVSRAPPGISESIIHNKNAKQGETAPFITRSLWPFVKEWGVLDHQLVKGYVVQRPDNPNQTVLVLACKDHLDFYVLNDKKDIEWIPIPLDKVGIERKPEIAIFFGENKIGQFVGAIVFDSTKINNLKDNTNGRSFIVLVYPNPNEKEGKYETGSSTLGIYEIIARK